MSVEHTNGPKSGSSYICSYELWMELTRLLTCHAYTITLPGVFVAISGRGRACQGCGFSSPGSESQDLSC